MIRSTKTNQENPLFLSVAEPPQNSSTTTDLRSSSSLLLLPLWNRRSKPSSPPFQQKNTTGSGGGVRSKYRRSKPPATISFFRHRQASPLLPLRVGAVAATAVTVEHSRSILDLHNHHRVPSANRHHLPIATNHRSPPCTAAEPSSTPISDHLFPAAAIADAAATAEARCRRLFLSLVTSEHQPPSPSHASAGNHHRPITAPPTSFGVEDPSLSFPVRDRNSPWEKLLSHLTTRRRR